MTKKSITRKELVLKLLAKMSYKNCWAGYIASRMNVPAQNVTAILNQLYAQGKLQKEYGHYCKVYYKLK